MVASANSTLLEKVEWRSNYSTLKGNRSPGHVSFCMMSSVHSCIISDIVGQLAQSKSPVLCSLTFKKQGFLILAVGKSLRSADWLGGVTGRRGILLNDFPALWVTILGVIVPVSSALLGTSYRYHK